MTPVRLEPVALRSRVKLSTTEPLRSLYRTALYQGYILPLIDYGSITWDTDVQQMSKLQKQATFIILNADFDIPYSLMFKECNWLSVEKRLKYNKYLQKKRDNRLR